MILDVIDLRKNAWVPRRKDNNPRRIEEIRKEAEEEQQRIADEIARNQQNDKRNMQGQMGQKGQKGYQGGQGSLKSTSMDSESYQMRGSKMQNGNMVNKIKDVKQIITNKMDNDALTLGPGGGSSFAWNKPKPPVSEASAASTITSSASFSTASKSSLSGSGSGSGSGAQQSGSRTLSSTQSMSSQSSYGGLKSKPNISETTSRLSMDSNKGNLNRRQEEKYISPFSFNF